jgi:hypothetical protein
MSFMAPPGNRKLTLVGVSTGETRTPKGAGSAAVSARDELNEILIVSGYFHGGPFSSVTVSVVFAKSDAAEPTYAAIAQNGDLELSIEVDVDRFSQLGPDGFTKALRDIALRSLIHAGDRYGRPTAELEAALG